MRGSRRLLACVLALGGFLVTCRLFVDLNDLGNGSDASDAIAVDAVNDAASDGPVVGTEGGADAAIDVGVDADAAIDSGPERPFNGGYEVSGADCGPGWSPVMASLTRNNVAHAGAYSCRICRIVAGTDKFDMVSQSNMPIAAGAIACTVRARIRSAVGDPAGTSIRLGIDWYDANSNYITDTGRDDLPYDAVFQEFTHTATPPALAVNARVFVGGNGPENSCALIDAVAFSCQ